MKTKLDEKMLEECDIDWLYDLYVYGGFCAYESDGNDEIRSYEEARDTLRGFIREGGVPGFNFDSCLDTYQELCENYDYYYVTIGEGGCSEVTQEDFVERLSVAWEDDNYDKDDFKAFYDEHKEKFKELGFRLKTLKEKIAENTKTNDIIASKSEKEEEEK